MPGRVLSKANEQKIRDALGALKGMLSFLEDDDEPEKPEKEQPAKADPRPEGSREKEAAVTEAALVESIEIREYASLTNQESQSEAARA